MECILHWKVDSLNILMIFKDQEMALVEASMELMERCSDWGGRKVK